MKLGAKPPVFTVGNMKASFAMNAILQSFGPPPPASADFIAAVNRQAGTNGWGMALNDELGCCTISDAAHTLMMRTANTGTMVRPTDAQVLEAYRAVSGYNPADPRTDQGAMESDDCKYMMNVGLCGHKSLGTAPIITGAIGHTGIDHLKWGVQVFGAVRLGVELPQSAMDQFDQHLPWTLGGDETSLGGHDVPLVKYTQQFAYVITWSRLQAVSWDWLTRHCVEAHAEVFEDFIRKSGTSPSGFHLSTMIRDLGALAVR